jgi:hypothetical protein
MSAMRIASPLSHAFNGYRLSAVGFMETISNQVGISSFSVVSHSPGSGKLGKYQMPADG